MTKDPMDGRTYLGLVVRDNDTWEMVGQKLSKPLEMGATYSFSLNLCRSLTYVSASRSTSEPVNYSTPAVLRIWGGFEPCNRSEMLATSEPVIDINWKEYQFTLSPSHNFTHIVLEAFYKTPISRPFNGNLLLDNASDIQLVLPAVTVTEADRHEFSRPLMGTDFRIVAYHPDSVMLKEAVEKAFLRVAVLEKVFSDYMENSEVSWLSDNGKANDISDELWEVLNYSLDVSRRSEGAFDVSVGALTKIWRRAFRQKEFPSNKEIEQATATVGFESIKTKERNKAVKLDKEGMRLDFGGIAAGYAVDEAMGWLKEYGITTALVEGGGDIYAGLPPPGQQGWVIEVPDKIVNGELTFKKVYLANIAITTSGDTYRYLEHEGKRYSHIIDPRTGYGLTNHRVVTVTAPTCMAADAWATAASVGIKKLLTVDLRAENIRINILEE